MSVKQAIVAQIHQIADEQNKTLPALTDDLVLIDSGLDSLSFAILVARLEDTIGVDPFSSAEEAYFPVTLGDFVRVYEHAVQ
jgi:acyl carrier protein